jgi:replicative DNA helicase
MKTIAMGKYEQLIKEDVACLITSKVKKLKDIEKKEEKDKFQVNIEIFPNAPCEVGYHNLEKEVKEKNMLRRLIPLTNAAFNRLMSFTRIM